ncbi:MAG TPA: cytochrome c [Acidimicrobiia bacterium]|nr:cytochrome c [Acidimicrobiia bacterium]
MIRSRLVVLALAVVLAACAGPATADDDPLTVGRDVYGRICASCHGPTGEGGAGPDLSGVLETFPTCEQHILWVELGSNRWKEEVGPTYGATDKEVSGVMPSFQESLTAEEIAQVAAYERVRFGGAHSEEAVAQCEGET